MDVSIIYILKYMDFLFNLKSIIDHMVKFQEGVSSLNKFTTTENISKTNWLD